jgi:hypothetical protein
MFDSDSLEVFQKCLDQNWRPGCNAREFLMSSQKTLAAPFAPHSLPDFVPNPGEEKQELLACKFAEVNR